MPSAKNKTVTSMDRRALLKQLGILGVSMVVTRCVSGQAGGEAINGNTESGACAVTAPDEVGPFPADGSNASGDSDPAVLDNVYPDSPLIRQDITESIMGIPLTLVISLQDITHSCEPLEGYYVYIWHCNPDGEYSAYTGSGNGTHDRTETYLRGIGQSNAEGKLGFVTVYPGWYAGRAVHIHAQVYKALDDLTPILTTQFAFPSAVNNEAQQTAGYKGNTGMLENSEDQVFSDGITTQMLTVSGSINGYVASITLRIEA